MSDRRGGRIEYPLPPALAFLQRLWQLDHALLRLSRQMEGRLGVTAHQRLIVRCIGKYPGLTAGQLAAMLHVDRGTISVGLDRLERKGLAARRADPRDGRRACLGLTKKGRALDQRGRGTVEEVVERLLSEKSADDLAVLTTVLARFTALLGEELVEGAAAGVAPRAPTKRRRSARAAR